MAEAATRLLGADRASIFLWDRPNHTLVGRPALGLPDGELRIPDDRGVVGEVIRTGQPRRVDAAIEPDAVDRKVDAQLRYQTRTLLCVPLRGRSGELFGAFELINKLSGTFTPEDEAALGELAAHAAVALENARDRQQLLAANRQIAQEAADKVRLIGQSPAIEALRSIIQPRGRDRPGRADPGRERHRQGGRRPVDPLPQPPPRPAVRGGQLRGHSRDAGRERVVRARERGVHRRPRNAPGQVRAGRRRHALPRRNRRTEPRLPGEAAPRARGEAAGPRGRIEPHPHRRPAAGRHATRTWPTWSGPSGSARTSISA